jgi:hypothetical protein
MKPEVLNLISKPLGLRPKALPLTSKPLGPRPKALLLISKPLGVEHLGSRHQRLGSHPRRGQLPEVDHNLAVVGARRAAIMVAAKE